MFKAVYINKLNRVLSYVATLFYGDIFIPNVILKSRQWQSLIHSCKLAKQLNKVKP